MDLKNHTVKSYDKDINAIAATLEDMLALSIQSIEMVESLLKKSQNEVEESAIIKKITDHDYKINSLDSLIEKKVTAMLALRQPMAVDLRYVISSLRVAGSLERIGDQAKSVIKKIVALDNQIIENGFRESLLKMLEISKGMVAEAVHAFNNSNLEEARDVSKQDDKIDNIYKEFFGIIDNPKFAGDKIRLMISILFIAKSLERLADHATEIADFARYVVTGENAE